MINVFVIVVVLQYLLWIVVDVLSIMPALIWSPQQQVIEHVAAITSCIYITCIITSFIILPLLLFDTLHCFLQLLTDPILESYLL